VAIPLAPRTARAIDLAIDERLEGPIFLHPDGQWMDRHCASRIVRRVARRASMQGSVALLMVSSAPQLPTAEVNHRHLTHDAAVRRPRVACSMLS
jgi:hypothetical protein